MSKEVTIDPNIWKTLDLFFATKTIQDIDRNTFLNCTLNDKINKIHITLVFVKHFDISESDTYNYVAIGSKGAVFTFPCYWVSVPKELAMPYFEYIIKEFYDKEVSGWADGSNSIAGSGNGTGYNSGCNCPPCGVV